MALQSNLKAYINLARLSQSEVAEMMECTVQQVSNWSTGYSTPPLEKAIKLARILNRPVEQIWEIKDDAQE